MTTFLSYDSIENHYRGKSVEIFSQIVPEDETCILTEKVHGANVQIFVSATNIRIARRSDFLTDGENFHGIQEIVATYKDKFLRVFDLLKDDADEISVCGEIFGGTYPGYKSTVSAVQKGVYYSNDRHLYVFDIRLFKHGQVYDGEHPAPYVDWNTFCKIIDEVGLFRAETLATITCRELCVQLRTHNSIPLYPPTFLSTIPSRLGYPEVSNNYAEGYVIRPTKCYFANNGNRQIFKYKNEKFAEVAIVTKPVSVSVEDEIQWETVADEFLEFTALKNRLDNVLSKESWELTDNKKRGLIVRALVEDVMKDVQKTYENFDHAKITKKLNGSCSKFVQQIVSSRN